MIEQEAINELKDIQKLGDIEIAHSQADDILCKLLISRGYEKVVAEYNKVDKWYA